MKLYGEAIDNCKQMKSIQRTRGDANTVPGCSKAEQITPQQNPFPGARDAKI